MDGQRLRPLGIGDVFDEGFDLYKRNFVFLLLVTAVTVVPLDIGLVYAGPRVMRQVNDLFDVTAQSDALVRWLLNVAVKLMLYLPLYALAAGGGGLCPVFAAGCDFVGLRAASPAPPAAPAAVLCAGGRAARFESRPVRDPLGYCSISAGVHTAGVSRGKVRAAQSFEPLKCAG